MSRLPHSVFLDLPEPFVRWISKEFKDNLRKTKTYKRTIGVNVTANSVTTFSTTISGLALGDVVTASWPGKTGALICTGLAVRTANVLTHTWYNQTAAASASYSLTWLIATIRA